jgi:hypothetical protein
MTPEWVVAICAILTIVGALVGVMWKFAMAVDRLSQSSNRMLEQLGDHQEVVDDHGNRIIKLETWRGYHDVLHENYRGK